jgi:predicted nucleic acid-binding protein
VSGEPSLLYLDTNIFLNVIYKEVLFEQSSNKLLQTLQKGNRFTAVTSSVTLFEMILDMGSAGFAEAADKVTLAMEDIPFLNIVSLNKMMSTLAARYLLEEKSLKSHDAYHLAAATVSGADLFVTRDKSLSKIASKFLEVTTPDKINESHDL